MITVPADTLNTQLFMHALSASIAMAADGGAILLDLGGIDEKSPAARKEMVRQRLVTVMGDLEVLIRAKNDPPSPSPAVLGSRLASTGENFNADKHSYTAGVGFEAYIKALAADADAAYEKAAANRGAAH
jgi:hypothetical protein